MLSWYHLDCKPLFDCYVCIHDLITWACLLTLSKVFTLATLFSKRGESQSPCARSTSVQISKQLMQPVMTQHLEIWCCHHSLLRNHVCWGQSFACCFGAADPAWPCQHVARGMGHQGLTNPASSAQAILRKAPAHVSNPCFSNISAIRHIDGVQGQHQDVKQMQTFKNSPGQYEIAKDCRSVCTCAVHADMALLCKLCVTADPQYLMIPQMQMTAARTTAK